LLASKPSCDLDADLAGSSSGTNCCIQLPRIPRQNSCKTWLADRRKRRTLALGICRYRHRVPRTALSQLVGCFHSLLRDRKRRNVPDSLYRVPLFSERRTLTKALHLRPRNGLLSGSMDSSLQMCRLSRIRCAERTSNLALVGTISRKTPS
jgi:hypothetical protein